MQADIEYFVYVIKFIDYIIRYSIIFKNKVHTLQSNAPSTSFYEFDLSFIWKPDVDLNVGTKTYLMHLLINNITC